MEGVYEKRDTFISFDRERPQYIDSKNNPFLYAQQQTDDKV